MEKVKFEQAGPVGSVVLANPPHNAIDAQFIAELTAAVDEAGRSGVRVILLRADGPNFSVGADPGALQGRDGRGIQAFILETIRAFTALESLRIPVIAAVRGPLLGGSYELVLRADVIVASDTATFTWLEAGSGNTVQAGGAQRLAARVGLARASAQLLLDETLTAWEAESIGLVYKVVPDDELDGVAHALAERLGTGGTRGLAATRALLRAWSTGGVGAADAVQTDLGLDLFGSEDLQAAFSAYQTSVETGQPYVRPTLTGQ